MRKTVQISDAKLVRRCKDGDREAFNMLIRRYQHAVYGLCYHFVGDFADAQDLTQETFVRVYLRPRSFLLSLTRHGKNLIQKFLHDTCFNIC